MNFFQLKSLFVHAGCVKLYAKVLVKNNNTKQQVYFGTSFESLNLLPNKGVKPSEDPTKVILKAALDFSWLLENGALASAPGAQIILYPQYPEVRFSGFLEGCDQGPSDLMNERTEGRILFLGITKSQKIIGFVAAVNSEITKEFRSLGLKKTIGVFYELSLPNTLTPVEARTKLLSELHRINTLGWIDSKQLSKGGVVKPCRAQNCGGYTLEAELGIEKNSSSSPDFHGWEVKQHAVSNFENPDSGGAITLLTPEPDGGFYHEHGLAAFVRKYGYADTKGRPDRLNFNGVHRSGERHSKTQLTLTLLGYDPVKQILTNSEGCVALVTDEGEIASAWAFGELFSHWSRKHSQAVYVPSKNRMEPSQQYCYGNKVRLCEWTDSLRLLKAFAAGLVYYDPGIKLEQASTDKSRSKPRSQFRISSKNISAIYRNVQIVEV